MTLNVNAIQNRRAQLSRDAVTRGAYGPSDRIAIRSTSSSVIRIARAIVETFELVRICHDILPLAVPRRASVPGLSLKPDFTAMTLRFSSRTADLSAVGWET